jgi:hypothetical protein
MSQVPQLNLQISSVQGKHNSSEVRHYAQVQQQQHLADGNQLQCT